MALHLIQTPEIVQEAARALVRVHSPPPPVELIDKTQVCIVLIHQGVIHYRTATWLDRQRIQGAQIIAHTEPALIPHENDIIRKYLNCTCARDNARKLALEKNAKWIMFLDADVVPPVNALDHFLLQKTPVRGGWYPIKMPEGFGKRYVAGRWVAGNTLYNYTKPKRTRLFESHILPAGCCMMDREVAELVSFEHGTDIHYTDAETGHTFLLGECGMFGNRLEELGESIWMNPAVICDHEDFS